MKNRKTVLILLSLVLFVCLFFPAAAESAENVKLDLQPSVSEASVGDEVIFSMNISGNPGIMAMTLGINFDENRLEFIGFEDSGYTGWSVTAKKAACVEDEDLDLNGEILNLKYRVKSDAPTGDAFVTVLCSDGDFADSQEQPYGADVVPGIVTITKKTDPVHPRPRPGTDPWDAFFRLEEGILPRTGFSAFHPIVLSEKPLSLEYKPVNRTLEIPSVSAMADIVEIPFVNGEYPITWLGGNVGLLEGFALPGKGHTVLTGHNHLNNTEAGPFANLAYVQQNDRIFVHDGRNGLQIYVVYANEKVSETDLASVRRIAEMYAGSITMITCEDELVTGGYANRRIVAARPFGS